MPYYMTDVAAGAKAGMDSILAKPTAITELAQKQVTLQGTQQENALRGYQIQDASEIEQLAAQNKAAEDKIAQDNYNKVFTESQKAQQDIERRKRNIKFNTDQAQAANQSPAKAANFRLAAEHEQKQLDDIEAKQLALQSKQMNETYAVLDNVNNQGTYDTAVRNIGNQAVAAAKVNGVPDENLEMVRKEATKDFPPTYGTSAKYAIETNKAKSLTTRDYIDLKKADNAARIAEARLEEQKLHDRARERKSDIAIARGEAKDYRDEVRLANSNVTTTRLAKENYESTAATNERLDLETAITKAESDAHHYFGSPSADETVSLVNAKEALRTWDERKTQAIADYTTAVQNRNDIIERNKAREKLTGEKINTGDLELPKPTKKTEPSDYTVTGEAAKQGYDVATVVQAIRDNRPDLKEATDKELADAAIKVGWLKQNTRK